MTVQLDDECLDGSPAEVPVDVSALLDTMVERRACVDRAEADLLALVVEFADACPEGVPDSLLDNPKGANTAPTGGVAETAVVELAARLGMSFRSAAGLVVDAVELRDRLPRLWVLVQVGRLQAWKARQVARVTLTLPDPVAGFIDAQAAVSGRRNQVPDLRRLVIVGINRCDPDLAEGLEEAAAADRGVRFDFSSSTDAAATATVEATLDLVDALDLDATVTDLAAQLGRLGDGSPIGVRRAHALGLLGNPQRTLDLFGDPATPTVTPTVTATPTNGTTGPDTDADTGTDTDEDTDADTGSAEPVRSRMPWDQQSRWNSQIGHLYLHLDADDLRAGAGGVDLERLGAASLTLVREWLGRVDRVSVRPVLDIGMDDTVDQHDPPEVMREQVILRDGRCVFPGCRTHARACDLDHIDPYVPVNPRDPVDHGGPPGQTRPGNLACLCRRHHRMKTHHGWDYHRTRDGTYEWTDPRGTSYTTAPEALHLGRPDRA